MTNAGADVFVAPGALVEGDVTLAEKANVWYGARVSGVAAPVVLARGANVQDNCVVEGVAAHPAVLGEYVTMGHNARVFGASIDARVLIAMGATVHPGASVGTHSIVAANAEVPAGMQVPPRSLVIGNGRIVRQTTEVEVQRIVRGGDEYERLAGEYRRGV